MAVRLQKKKKISKHSWLNFSKSGVSFSIGSKGKTLNFGKHGVTSTLGIPGTGISFRTRFGTPNQKSINKKTKVNTLRSSQVNLAAYNKSGRRFKSNNERQEKLKFNLYMWRLSIWILAIFLSIGFLLGQNPYWSLGTIILTIITTIIINKCIHRL